MTFIEKFNSYYKAWFITGFFIFGGRLLLDLTDKNNHLTKNLFEGILVVVLLSSMIGLTCGGIYHWFYEVYRPTKTKKLFKLVSHLNFEKIGLNQKEEENCFAGFYKDYFHIITPDIETDGKKWVKIKSFIVVDDELLSNQKQIQKELEIVQIDDGLTWVEQKLILKKELVPNEQIFIDELNKQIVQMKTNNLKPEKNLIL